MSTDTYPHPNWFFTAGTTNGPSTIYTNPKLSSLQDVPDYSTSANKYVAVNSGGTGLTYVSGNGGSAPTRYADLSDVNAGSLSSSIGYFAVVAEDGASITYKNSADILSVTEFQQLSDTFTFAGNGRRLAVVSRDQTRLEPTNFLIEDLTNAVQNTETCLQYFYQSSNDFTVYTNRPKSRATWEFHTPQSGSYAHTNSGYDTTTALTSNVNSLFGAVWLNIGCNADFMVTTNSSYCTLTQNPVINGVSNIWTLSANTGRCQMNGYSASTAEGTKNIMANVKMRVTITAYIQFDQNPDKEVAVNIGYCTLDISGNVKNQPLYDTCTLKAIKPGRSGHISKTFITESLLAGESIQPQFRIILLNNDGNPGIQIVDFVMLMEEV